MIYNKAVTSFSVGRCSEKESTLASSILKRWKWQKGDGSMIPRIKSVTVSENYHLHVIFDSIQLDESRTCVFWNDYIDLPSDMIYEHARISKGQ